jgi:hypothetical protein
MGAFDVEMGALDTGTLAKVLVGGVMLGMGDALTLDPLGRSTLLICCGILFCRLMFWLEVTF